LKDEQKAYEKGVLEFTTLLESANMQLGEFHCLAKEVRSWISQGVLRAMVIKINETENLYAVLKRQHKQSSLLRSIRIGAESVLYVPS
jgi:hypothetical protein